jgi:hypothetical protein
MKLITYERIPPTKILDEKHLEQLISSAFTEAREEKVLNMIFLVAENENELGFVVGGDETVLSFEYGSLEKPYFASYGASSEIQPVMTCYAYLLHHTEFPRKYEIPFNTGLQAAFEFFKTNELPCCVGWMEV